MATGSSEEIADLPNGWEVDLLESYTNPGRPVSKFGDQLRGNHKDVGKCVVKRIIPKEKVSVDSGITFESLDKEIEHIKQRVKHKNIIKILDHCFYIGNIWIIYDYCNEKDLQFFLQRHHSNAHISVRESIIIMSQCADGVAYLHNMKDPIIHCFLHPGNILLKKENEGYVVKITDYLMATVFEGNPFEKQSRTVSSTEGTSDLSESEVDGKVYTTAPEYLDVEFTHPPLRPSFDVFCIGVVFHAVLSHSVDALKVSLVPIIPGCKETSIAEYVDSNDKLQLFIASAERDETNLHTIIEGMLCRDPKDRTPMTTVTEQLRALNKSEKEQISRNESICRKLTDILQQQGPLDAKDRRLFDTLTASEVLHIMTTAGSVSDFVAQYCNTINIEDGLLMYKPLDVIGPVLDPDKVTKMANMMCNFMHLLEQNTVIYPKIRGSYFNAFTEKIYLHFPVEDQPDVNMFLQQLQCEQYRPYIQIQDDEQLVAEPFTNRPGILSYLGLGCRLMNDTNLVVHGMTQGAAHWTQILTNRLIALRYGTLGVFAQNNNNNHVFALSAKHILDVAANGSVNIITFTQDQKNIKKTDSVVSENLNVSMQESVFLGNDFIGLFGIIDDKLVDVAIIGPFPATFTQSHNVYQPQRAHKVTSRTDYDNWSHKKVKIVGATSGLSKGRVIASSLNVEAKTSVLGNTIDAKTFLVASYDEVTGQWKDDSDFAEAGDSGSMVFWDEYANDTEEEEQGLQALGLVHGGLASVTLGGHTYRNVVVCVYMDVCMEALQRMYNAKYGGQLQLLDYSYIPEWRLKQGDGTNTQQPANQVLANRLPGFQLSHIRSVVGIRQFSSHFKRNPPTFWFWSMLIAVFAIVIGFLCYCTS